VTHEAARNAVGLRHDRDAPERRLENQRSRAAPRRELNDHATAERATVKDQALAVDVGAREHAVDPAREVRDDARLRRRARRTTVAAVLRQEHADTERAVRLEDVGP